MEILDQILQAAKATSWLERFSVLCGIIQVLLSKNNKVSNYLFGILGIISGMYIYFGAKLYADIALNMYYLIMSVYGWWYWKTNKEAKEQPITRCNAKEWGIVLAIVVVGFFILSLSLTHFTDSDVPVWDAWVSSTAWAGMWLLARRKIENWILLNISNVVSHSSFDSQRAISVCSADFIFIYSSHLRFFQMEIDNERTKHYLTCN
ncbi:nicotinamide riboside transporter PnuC [Sphingobacterium sp. T2]|uniref:nicotinamide riboside transporter PnuC n=1 Tax=Sphingobacterium sp. T2 TaxID=1590596 RepID=UPI000B1A4E35|nr:nicotinamide riboside transporter PnuC [Sphingobacterium sp. T2]